ncbi:MAG: hypothetical protein ACEQSR_03210 [Candidatus Methylacidiphilales bacterium]
MKKIIVIVIAFLAIFNNKGFAQGGIDVSVLPMDLVYNFGIISGKERGSLYSGVAQGFQIGRFDWGVSNSMRTLSFQYTSLQNEFYHINNGFQEKQPIETYTQTSKSYAFKFGAIKVLNDIDFKSHVYLKASCLLGLRLDNVDFVNKRGGTLSSNEKTYDNELEIPVGFIFGFEYGVGYQYNINRWLGVYADITGGVRIFELMPFVTTSVGTRLRLY